MNHCYCPICGTKLPLPPTTDGKTSAMLNCPTCQQDFPSPAPARAAAIAAETAVLYQNEPGYEADAPAWETRQGAISGLWQTTWQMLLHPMCTLGAAGSSNMAWPLGYGLIMSTLGGALLIFYNQVLEDGSDLMIGPLPDMALTPFINLAALFIISAVLHASLWLVRGARTGFKGSFRAFAYSQASNIFFLIPVVGIVINLVWWMVIMVGGLAAVHGISKQRAFWALVLPVLALLFLVLLTLLVIGAGTFFSLLQNQGGMQDLFKLLI
jgi:hypothetical protein